MSICCFRYSGNQLTWKTTNFFPYSFYLYNEHMTNFFLFIGARMVSTLLNEMGRKGKDCRFGVISMCIGERKPLSLMRTSMFLLPRVVASLSPLCVVSLQAQGWEQQPCLREAMQWIHPAMPDPFSPTTFCRKMLECKIDARTRGTLMNSSGARTFKHRMLRWHLLLLLLKIRLVAKLVVKLVGCLMYCR